MSDSYLNGTNKEDQKANKGSGEKKPGPSLQGVQSQPSDPSKTGGGEPNASSDHGDTVSAKPKNTSEHFPGAATGEEHLRTIDSPPGEPYNDPSVRNSAK